MTDPIITVSGESNGLFLITDHHGMTHRIPKVALCNIANSSNRRVFRIDVCLMSNEITLLFNEETALDKFLTDLESFY